MGLVQGFLNPVRHLLLAWGLLGSVLGTGSGLVMATPVTPTLPTPAGAVEVQDGDMASVLAFRLKPRGATIEQMMVALLARNPEAFILGNVNLLKQGAVLRLPPAEEVLRLPPEQAREMVQRHHQASVTELHASNAQALAAMGVVAPAAPSASAPHAPTTDAAQAADPAAERQALLDRLRLAKARLNELQHNIQELERLTQAPALALSDTSSPSAASAIPAPPQTDWPSEWIWLGVGALLASMIGVGYSRASRPTPHPAQSPTDKRATAAAQFQARLGELDLDLGSPPPSSSGRTP